MRCKIYKVAQIEMKNASTVVSIDERPMIFRNILRIIFDFD